MNKTLLIALLCLAAICRVSFGETNQICSQAITYQCSVISSDKPIEHDFSKLLDSNGIHVMTAPAITGKIDCEVCAKVTRKQTPELVNNLKCTESFETGTSVFVKGILDQNKIILIGMLQNVYVTDRSTTQDSTSLATTSNDIYFSKIIENGKEAWFDVNYPDQKPKYLTVRVVPTLVPAKP